LLGVIEFGGAAGFFPKDVIDVFEGLFEHIVSLKVFLSNLLIYHSVPQRLKSIRKQAPDRSGKPLRHPKSKSSEPGTDVSISKGNRKRPSQKFAASPSLLFASQTSVTALTDTQSAKRDNGDGLGAGARLGQSKVGDLELSP
jgi:hypothetical protein